VRAKVGGIFWRTLTVAVLKGGGKSRLSKDNTGALPEDTTTEERCGRPGLAHRTRGLFTIALSAANDLRNYLTEGRGRDVKRRHVKLTFSMLSSESLGHF
jgi:hypothetical protein